MDCVEDGRVWNALIATCNCLELQCFNSSVVPSYSLY